MHSFATFDCPKRSASFPTIVAQTELNSWSQDHFSPMKKCHASSEGQKRPGHFSLDFEVLLKTCLCDIEDRSSGRYASGIYTLIVLI